MKKIELWLNIVHYCFYKAEYRRYLLSNKLNPFMLFGKMPAVKEKFEQQGTSHSEVVNKIWGDKRYGFGILISGGVLAILVFFVIWTVFLFANSLLKKPIDFSWIPFTICMGLAYAICHLTVFQNDKYIGYFREFEKWTKQKKWNYGLASLALVIAAIALFIYSFRFIPGL